MDNLAELKVRSFKLEVKKWDNKGVRLVFQRDGEYTHAANIPKDEFDEFIFQIQASMSGIRVGGDSD
jgi:hypothetical protein